MKLDKTTYSAFSNEMQKIALISPGLMFRSLGTAARSAGGAIREGWHGGNLPGSGWRWSDKGVGRFLPGAKSLTLAGTAASLPGALTKEDPAGQDRSRAERVGGLAGETLGGLAGSGFALKHMKGPVSGMVGGLVGGVGGAVAGHILGAAPFAALRKRRAQKQMAPNPPQEPTTPETVQSTASRESSTGLI